MIEFYVLRNSRQSLALDPPLLTLAPTLLPISEHAMASPPSRSLFDEQDNISAAPPPPSPRHPHPPPSRQRYRFGQKCCGSCIIPECCYPLKFVIGLLNCKGTVMMRAFPQILLTLLWAIVVKFWYNVQPFTVPAVFWTPLYTVTVFLGVFRTNIAFQHFKNGRMLLGKMVDSLSCAIRFSIAVHHSQGNVVRIEEIIRLTNVVAAMIRIDLRESRIPFGASKGFSNLKWKQQYNQASQMLNQASLQLNVVVAPKRNQKTHRFASGVQRHPSTVSGSFWVDNDTHGSPPVSDLLNASEIQMYSSVSPSQRVVMSTTLLLKEFATSADTVATAAFEQHVIGVRKKRGDTGGGCGSGMCSVFFCFILAGSFPLLHFLTLRHSLSPSPSFFKGHPSVAWVWSYH